MPGFADLPRRTLGYCPAMLRISLMQARTVFAVLAAFAAACSPRLVGAEEGWRVERAAYRILPLESGTLMPSGWRLTNYTDSFRKKDPNDLTDLRFGTEDDAAFLWLEQLDGEKRGESLQQSVNLLLAQLKKVEESRTVTDLIGLPLARAKVQTHYDVVKVDERRLEAGGASALEVRIERSRLGARTVEEEWLISYLQAPGSRGAMIRVVYVNEPLHFEKHLPAVRDLVQRVRLDMPVAKE